MYATSDKIPGEFLSHDKWTHEEKPMVDFQWREQEKY